MNRVKLPEVCELIMGQSPDSTSYNKTKDGLPFYQGNANFGQKYPSPTVWCSSPKKIAKNNDILISVRAPIGDLNFANEECCIGRGLAAIRIKDNSNYSQEYLFAFLKSAARELQRKGTGSTFTAIGKTVLEELEIPLPPLPTQQKIAHHLDSIQNAIDNKKQQLFQLDELVKSKFVEMFGENPVESGKWKVEKLNDVSLGISDGSHNPPKGISETKYLMLSSKNIYDGYITLDEPRFLSEENHLKENKRTNIKADDILMTIVGTVGRCAVVPKFLSNITLQRSVSVIHPDFSKINSIYLMLYIQCIRNIIEETAHGVAQRGIYLEQVRSLNIAVPPIELQTTFATFVQKIDSAKAIVKKQLNDLNELLESKMDEYFS